MEAAKRRAGESYWALLGDGESATGEWDASAACEREHERHREEPSTSKDIIE